MVGFLAGSVNAQVAERKISLEEALELFAKNNLALQLSRSDAASFLGLARQAAAYPNPVVSVTHEPLSTGSRSYSESYFMLSQRLLWPGLRNARVEAANNLVSAARFQVAADSIRIAFEVISTYLRVSAEEDKEAVLLQVASLMRDVESSWTTRFDEGEVSGYDLRRMRLERARHENALGLGSLSTNAAKRELASLILYEDDIVKLTPIDHPQGIPQELTLDVILNAARIGRPEISSALKNVEASQSSLKRSQLENRIQPTVTAGYKRQSDGLDGVYFGGAVGLPLFDRNQGNIESEIAQKYAAETRHLLTIQEVENDVRLSFDLYQSLRNRMTLIQDDLLAEADDLLEIALTSYNEGEMTLLELMDAAEAFRDAHLIQIDMKTALWTNYFSVLRAAGLPLPSNFK